MADAYSFWSATNVVQILSEHTRVTGEYEEYLGLGQEAQCIHTKRQMLDKEKASRGADFGSKYTNNSRHFKGGLARPPLSMGTDCCNTYS